MSRPDDGIAHELRDLGATLDNVTRVLSRLQTTNSDGGRQPIVTVATVADWLGISARAVRKQIARGEIPATKVGRSYVVLLDLWLARLHAEADVYSPGGAS